MKNKKSKYILSSGAAVLALSSAIMFFSQLTEPKYVSLSREGNLIGDYYKEADAGREHDVIFIGDCEAYSSFIPPVMYEKYGFTSFVRGSPSQSMEQSYYILRETLRYERPQAVVFSVYAMCREGNSFEAYNRMTLDGMRMSCDKLGAVNESVGEGESLLSYILPLLRFHSRIYELEREDLEYLFSRPTVSHNGYFMQKGVKPPEDDISFVREAVVSLPSKNIDILEDMAELCRERGVELILVKSPISSWRYPWYSEWDAELYGLASRQNISYYKIGAEECEIELEKDSYDGGLHLNVWGAEKVSTCFGEMLCERHGICGEKNELWDEKVNEYYRERNS